MHHCERKMDRKNGYFMGGLFIVIGLLFLMDSLHVFDMTRYVNYWPLVLAVVGVWKMTTGESPRRFPEGVSFIFIGLYVTALMHRLWDMTFWNSWPVLLIVQGIVIAWKGMLPRHRDSREQSITLS